MKILRTCGHDVVKKVLLLQLPKYVTCPEHTFSFQFFSLLKLWFETWTLRASEQITRHSPAWLWAAPATACRRGSPSRWRTLGSVPDQQSSQLKYKYCSPFHSQLYVIICGTRHVNRAHFKRCGIKADLPIERRKVWKEIAQSRFPLHRVH